LLSFLFPSTCRFCGVFLPGDKIFCDACDEHIVRIPEKYIPLGEDRVITVYAASAYENPLKKLILKKAFSDRRASWQLGHIMSQKIDRSLSFDLIIPVPLHWTRYLRRGFNQSYEIGTVLSKELGIPMIDLLKRTKMTRHQSEFSGNDRQANVKDVFEIRKKYVGGIRKVIENKNILFVDDLCTSGATLKNMALPLLAESPQSISAFVACRAIPVTVFGKMHL
jgi:ComF family protein